MKIRQGFVTNSSSTSFGTAAVSGAVTAILSALGISSAYAAAESAEELPEGSPSSPAGPDRNFDPNAFVESDVPHEEKISRLDREMEEYRKEWEEAKDTYEGADYDAKKKEYDDYLDYLESLKSKADVIEFDKQVKIAQEEAEAEYRADWIEQRKEDLRQTKEQIEMIEATIRGYGKAGYDIKEAESQLEVYREREKQLNKTLKKEGVEFDYQARKRQDIGPSPVIQEKLDEIEKEYEAFVEQLRQEKINRKKKAIIERNMEAWEEESKGYMKYANTADNYKKAAEITQVAADVGVDVLEKVTGPAGKTIKKAYVGLKGAAGGLGEAMADPANATSHIVKGTIKGLGDMGKEFTDSQNIKDGIGYVSEISQEMVTSYQKGENPGYGIVRGVGKASIDAVVDRKTSGFFKPFAESDGSKQSMKSLIKNMSSSDSSLRNAFKNSIKENLGKQAINQFKNDWKGQGMVSSDWSMTKYSNPAVVVDELKQSLNLSK